MGDWGSVFFDGMATSAMTYCHVQYGEGIWAQGTARPYINACEIINVCGNQWWSDPMPWAAVWFENPETSGSTPKVRLVGNHIASPEEAVGIYFWEKPGAKTLDPYIYDNTIRGDYGLDIGFEDATETGGNHTLKGAVRNNRISTADGNNEAIYLYVETTGTAMAKIQTSLSDNSVTSQDDDGLYAEAYCYTKGSAECVPTWTGGSIYSYSYAFDCEAYSTEETQANPGHAWASPLVSNTTLPLAEPGRHLPLRRRGRHGQRPRGQLVQPA